MLLLYFKVSSLQSLKCFNRLIREKKLADLGDSHRFIGTSTYVRREFAVRRIIVCRPTNDYLSGDASSFVERQTKLKNQGQGLNFHIDDGVAAGHRMPVLFVCKDTTFLTEMQGFQENSVAIGFTAMTRASSIFSTQLVFASI